MKTNILDIVIPREGEDFAKGTISEYDADWFESFLQNHQRLLTIANSMMTKRDENQIIAQLQGILISDPMYMAGFVAFDFKTIDVDAWVKFDPQNKRFEKVLYLLDQAMRLVNTNKAITSFMSKLLDFYRFTQNKIKIQRRIDQLPDLKPMIPNTLEEMIEDIELLHDGVSADDLSALYWDTAIYHMRNYFTNPISYVLIYSLYSLTDLPIDDQHHWDDGSENGGGYVGPLPFPNYKYEYTYDSLSGSNLRVYLGDELVFEEEREWHGYPSIQPKSQKDKELRKTIDNAQNTLISLTRELSYTENKIKSNYQSIIETPYSYLQQYAIPQDELFLLLNTAMNQ